MGSTELFEELSESELQPTRLKAINRRKVLYVNIIFFKSIYFFNVVFFYHLILNSAFLYASNFFYFRNKQANNQFMNNQKDIIKVRVHDGIVGLLNISSILLASQFGLNWIYVAVAVAVLQIISPITKFCPVYTILNKLMPDTTPMQNGR